MPPIPVILIGAGQRGAEAYASYALRRPEEIRVIGVAEADEQRRARFGDEHEIPQKRRFRSWQDLFDAPQLAEAVLICTDDEQHVAPATIAMRAGYHVMLETPLARTAADCLKLSHLAQDYDRMLLVTHVLRYTAFYRALHDIVQSGRLGQIINYTHHYSIAFWHMAHRFVRGQANHNHRNPMLLTGGVHELDLMLWLLNDPIDTISSVGSLRHFRESSAPIANVPIRCVNDCPIEHECPFSSIGIYLEKRFRNMPTKGWLYTSIADGKEDPGALVQAVEEGPYGRCVYHCDNDVVDQQGILMQTRSGISANISISGHGLSESRLIKIDGSHGSLVADFDGLDSRITVFEHSSKKENTINFRLGPNGHGGDHGIMGALVKAIRGEADPLSLVQDVVDAHLLAFAAEDARLTQKVIHVPQYIKEQSELV